MDYNSIELTPEELAAAILEGKKKKYFHERSKDYWASLEKGKTKLVAYQQVQPSSFESAIQNGPADCSSSK